MVNVQRLDPTRGLVRGVRAAVLTVPAVGVAAVAHTAAGGCTSVWGLALATALGWSTAVALLAGEARLPRLLIWLVLAQGLTHTVLNQFCTHAAAGSPRLLERLSAGASPAMLSLHAASAVVMGLLLRRADRGLWATRALCRAGARVLRAVRALLRPWSVLLPVPRRGTPAQTGRVAVLRDLVRSSQPPGRGPPLLLPS